MPRFLGLDCGGSTTRALMTDESGATLFCGRAGAANLSCTPVRVWSRNLERAVLGAPTPDAVCACFAGLLTQEHKHVALTKLWSMFPQAKYVAVYPDYVAAHMASAPEPDFTVIAGTGSLVCSRTHEGFATSGGGGYLLGDFGSAYRYGREALKRYLDDPSSATPGVRSLVARLFGAEQEHEVLAAVYRSRSPNAALARLASGFKHDLHAGVPYAEAFLIQESRRQAENVVQHVRRYLHGVPQLEGRLAGGLWKLSPRFESAFKSALESLAPDVSFSIRRCKAPPVAGAIRLAMETHDQP